MRAATLTNLPGNIRACLFDLDGVLTRTATLHEAAWTCLFAEYLARRPPGLARIAPFSTADYAAYVDGRPRADGVRAFLKSRGITLPEGRVFDPPGVDTVASLGTRKRELLLERLRAHGVEIFDGSVRLVHAVRAEGIHTAVVSASTNCEAVLMAAGITSLFEARVDGVLTALKGFQGKPSPEAFCYAADLLGVEPADCAIFEDALAGVAAGRAGRFGLVVGVDRLGQASALRASGADIVVGDLAQLLR